MILEHCNRLSCVQIIEALTKERDHFESVHEKAVRRHVNAETRIVELREALAEASNEISDLGQYASEYFQGKYKLAEIVDRYAKIAAGEMK